MFDKKLNSNSMKISVVIPTIGLQVEKTRSLITFLCSLPDIVQDIVIVNQSTNSVIEEVQLPIKNISVSEYKVDWRGLSRARNFGARIVSGYFVAFLDDDIAIGEKSLEAACEFLVKNSNYAGVTGRAINADGKASNVGKVDDYSRDIKLKTVSRATLEATMVFRRDVFLKYFFNEMLGIGALFGSCEGRDLIVRMLRNHECLYFLYEYEVVHDDLPLSGHATCKRYYYHGLGIGGYFLIHRDFKALFFEFLKNILACIYYIFRPALARRYLAKLSGILGALSIGLPAGYSNDARINN